MRAFLFASATQALVVPSPCCLSAIQTLRTLFVMYLEHRMRTFQGTFHAKPRLRSVVRMERDAAGPDRDQGIGSRDEAKPKRGRGNAENHSTERYTASQLI
jgi:hypothetical protein